MKLCKKKMAILATVCALMLVMVFVLCSFDKPSYSSSAVSFSGLNTYEVDGLISIALLQYDVGAFNSFIPMCIYYTGTGVDIYFGSLAYGSNFYAFLDTTDNTLSFRNITSSATFYTIFCDGGFSFFQRSAAPTFDYSQVLGYWPNASSDFVRNENFNFSNVTDPNSDYIVAALDYWIDYHSLLSYDPAEAESIYNHGYTDGYLTGNLDGYRNGYDEGVDYGYNVGYPAGYDSGLADGYESGYDKGYETGYDNGYYQGDIDGYESGYDDGYSDGYETAERETVIEYVEPVELDIPHIFDGMKNGVLGIFQFVNWDIFGINILGVLLSITIAAILVFVFKRLRL